MTRFVILLVILTQLASSLAGGQRRTGSITGRVTSDSGEPVANALVSVYASGDSPGTVISTATDEEGRFLAAVLTPGLYSVQVTVAGFVVAADSSERKYYRIGDSVNIRLTKGGVITGTVTDPSGEPVIAARAVATLVRDSSGRALSKGRSVMAWTDDRGVYRIYGLESGSYLVSIEGNEVYYRGYRYEVPVYYPSSTRDGAKEVAIQNGQEATGIDIRYRSERGHCMTGTFSGSIPSEPQAVLRNVGSWATWRSVSSPLRENARSFAVYGLPDGDYQVVGQSYVEGEGASASAPRHVTVKGADVTGVELALMPLGSVTGRLTLETLKGTEVGTECKDRRRGSLEETVALIRRDPKSVTESVGDLLSPGEESAVNEKGEFSVFRLIAGRYHIEARSPNEDWFIRSVTLSGTSRSRASIDIAKEGLALAAGQRVNGVVVTAAEGAAAIRGKVVPASEAGSLPVDLRVHLVPAERASADDALRFAEVSVNKDGQFSLSNVAPGRYFIMARPIADDEWMERIPRPLAWDSAARARLRQEMESVNAIVELRPCQRVAEYVLRYTTPAPPKALSKRAARNL